MMKHLDQLVQGVVTQTVVGETALPIQHIVFDSRTVVPGSLFAAIRGIRTDGHLFIEQAIDAGAVAILCEALPVAIHPQITYVQVKNVPLALGLVLASFFDHPSTQLKLIGVTGTNGKTTIVSLLFQLFRDLGYTCGLLSTLGNQVNDARVASTHTTPDALTIHTLLKKMVDESCVFCFMEVSSHAIAQHRIAGLHFAGGIFSNITHDHLDFHGNFQNYLNTKKAFFDHLPKGAFALVNHDDKHASILVQNTVAAVQCYSLRSEADYKAKVLESQFAGMLLQINQKEIWTRLTGRFNAYNLLAVYAAAILLGQDPSKTLVSLSKLASVKGRFNCLMAPSKIIGIVDYAHTPDAIQNVLKTIRSIKNKQGKIITVIGCGGNRDPRKRPTMATIACRWSNQVIFTSDNPRFEDPNAIIQDMQTGIPIHHRNKALAIIDRKEAIKTACRLAQKGDIILLAGKGHEAYQEINGVQYPFDDQQVLAEQWKLVM